jgi:hypothetical protein
MSASKYGSDVDARSEQQGLAFLHQARKVRDLDPARVERIALRLGRPGVRPRRALLWPTLAAACLVLLAGATLAVAQGGFSALPIVGSLFSPSPALAPATSPRRGSLPRRTGSAAERHQPAETRHAEPSLAPLPPEPPPSQQPRALLPQPPPALQPSKVMVPTPSFREQPDKVEPPVARPYPGDGAHARPAEAPLPEADDTIVAESRAFAEVIESWRRQHEAGTALLVLDAYERRYPMGHMLLEARVLRAEIYLAQGQNDAALTVLDAMALSGLPRARELQTVRGELRVKAGRCREARADLGDVLEKNLNDALAGRATRALSRCP